MVTPVRCKFLGWRNFNLIKFIGQLSRLLDVFEIKLSLNSSQKQAVLLTLLSLFIAVDLFAFSTKVQFIHASKSDNPLLNLVDVYVNGSLLANDLAFKSATTFLEINNISSTVIGVAPANSLSVNDAFFTDEHTFSGNAENYFITLTGDPVSSEVPFQLLISTGALIASNDPLSSQVAFIHSAQDVGGLDVVLRSGPMILNDLGYLEYSDYQTLSSVETYLDVKLTGTTNIISTYRLSLQSEQGRAFVILVTGAANSATSLQLTVVYPDGFTIPVDFAPVSRVQYINALPSVVDIYKNGTRFADDVAQGDALLYKYVPAALNINIGISDFSSINGLNPWSTTPVVFENMFTYTAVSAGPMDAPVMFFSADAREQAANSTEVDLRCFNADHTKGSWSVVASDGAVLFNNVQYGSASDYSTMNPGSQVFQLINDAGFPIGQTASVDLTNRVGQALTLMVVPPSDEGVNALPQTWLIDANGTSDKIEFQSTSVDKLFATTVISIFPNPVVDRLYIKQENMTKADFQILNMQGQIVQQGQITEDKNFFDTSLLNRGMYILKFNHLTLKFIK
jgi:Secretion system C-terminal sorting domain